MKKLLIAMLSLAASGLVMAQEPPPPPPDGAVPPPPPPAGQQPGRPQFTPERQIKMLERQYKLIVAEYDKDGDGVLSEEEKAFMDKDLDPQTLADKTRKSRFYTQFKAIDTDKDGVINDAERAAAPEKLKEAMRPPRPGFGGPEGQRPPRGDRPGRPPRGGDRPGQRPPRGGDRGGQHPEGQNPPPPPAEK